MDGYCAMEGCRSSSGSGFSNFCWMSGYDDGYYERCGGNSECRAAVKAGGSCKAFSCAFFRAPNPFTSHEKTCSYKIAKTLRDLQNECSAEGANFDSWARAYRTSGDLYRKFEPCTGHLIEKETKKVIKFCYCYNFCGTGQVYSGCEVDGLEGRLDKGANLFSSYRAMYVVCMFLFYCVRVLFYPPFFLFMVAVVIIFLFFLSFLIFSPLPLIFCILFNIIIARFPFGNFQWRIEFTSYLTFPSELPEFSC